MRKLFILIILLVIPFSANASGISKEFYPHSDSKYYLKKITWKLVTSYDIRTLRFTQYDINNIQRGQIKMKVKGDRSYWIDFFCQGNVGIEFLDQDGNVKDVLTRGPGIAYINNSSCKYKSFVKKSNFNEKKRRYKN